MTEKQKVIKRLEENPLDRERWIEAGKAMGWNCTHCKGSGKALNNDKCHNCYGTGWADEWKKQWHKLIDTLANGGSIESFFKDLK